MRLSGEVLRMRLRTDRSSVDYENNEITQHTLKVSRVFRMLKLDTTQTQKKKKSVWLMGQ